MASSLHSDDLEIGFWTRVLRRRAPTIVLVVLGSLGAAVAAMLIWPSGYTATSEVLVRSPLLTSTTVTTAATTDVASELVFLQSRFVKEQAARRLGFTPDVEAEASPDSRVIDIRARADTAREASLASSTYASTYVELRSRVDERERRDAAASLQQSIEDLDRLLAADDLSDEQRDRLEAQRAAYVSAADSVLVSAQLAAHEIVSVLSLASTATTDQKPEPALVLTVAGLAGLLLGVLVGGVREQLDDHVRTPDDVAATVDAPLLATVPAVYHRRGWRRTALAEPGSPSVEALALVRARVHELASDKPCRTVQVSGVGAAAELEATAVAINLAAGCARIGQRAVLVMADLRTRRHVGFPVDLRAEPGLSAACAGSVTVSEALVPVEAVPGLSVLPAGKPPVSVPDTLASPGLPHVLDELASDAEVIVVLTTPLPGPPDAELVADTVDGTILVAMTPRRAVLSRAVNALRDAHANLVGVVLCSHERHGRASS